METLELTINPGYVRNWGTWEAVRELVQNCIDAHDLGFAMRISYDEERESLTLKNDGITMERQSLLLGGTSKADDDRQRGKFGEGFKLAWLVLLRSGLTVECISGGEVWTPVLAYSESYKSELVKVGIHQIEHNESVVMRIDGLDSDSWDAIKERFLFLEPPKDDEIVDLGNNKILTGKRYRGHLYSRGIHVGKMNGAYFFGYDLATVNLDRDRRIADPFSLQYRVSDSLTEAIRQKKMDEADIYAIFNSEHDWAESDIASNFANINDALSQGMASRFKEVHGDDAVPVYSTAESIEAKHHGLRGVVVKKGLKKLIEFECGGLAEAKKSKATEVRKRLEADELSDDEVKNLEWAINRVASVEPVPSTTVVEFNGDKVIGIYKPGDDDPEIMLSKSIMEDRSALVSTLVHEVAHKYGGDGTLEHSEAMQRIFGDVIAEASQ